MWFTENAWPPMLIAGLAALVCLAMWNSNRRGVLLAAAVGCLLLCVGFFFLERAIVTEGERLQMIVVSLCDDFRNKRPATLNYFSNTAPVLKVQVLAAMALVDVDKDLRLTDFQSHVTNQNSRGTVHFRANATMSVTGHGNVGHQPARLNLTFQREQGEWKIIEVERLNPLTGEKMGLLTEASS